ncbi:hypothetical protein HYH02_009846 [Chlamydomonas schloesseri]|uniref:Uncharacterized protein n=1 Tax=Chlamydomonas schloesseri TaxID=2026947 RepID=A0A835TQ82_9CHLO|nr:hypothetical protein HYH02_009846 [Chlamydomonas schloesseri]|eukprot:KAG2442055.1 hypothetical protein HYH02_009846 [Chlamydomonas schloesseri]
MQTSLAASLSSRASLGARALPARAGPTGSRLVALARRKGGAASKELQELKQEKAAPPPAPVAAPAPAASAPAPVATPAAPTPAAAPASSSSSSPSTSSPAPSPTSSASTSGSAANAQAGAGNGIFDSLLFRILGSVTAIMAVISVFYSIVFYGASNITYVFKDQLAAITKKDFVPYSERRRMEQEVLAKLELEQAERIKAKGPASSAAADAPVVTSAPADSSSPDELLNLLPNKAKN